MMSLLCQYVDECHSLTDKADSIHEKVSFIIWPASPAAAFICILHYKTCFVFDVFPAYFAVRKSAECWLSEVKCIAVNNIGWSQTKNSTNFIVPVLHRMTGLLSLCCTSLPFYVPYCQVLLEEALLLCHYALLYMKWMFSTMMRQMSIETVLLSMWTVSWKVHEQLPWSSMKTYRTLLSNMASKAKNLIKYVRHLHQRAPDTCLPSWLVWSILSLWIRSVHQHHSLRLFPVSNEAF